ncbi:hypothetical protein EYF80_052918 [Liparis tanakae]|uniref:Uncharacterized protein n=1 Tax=Liparis tanakae TaxID=230148 RepID=A0A4Z2F7P8_9TELE|nr:hypothetical protein EYF80_052918 [Liparis tanakae]
MDGILESARVDFCRVLGGVVSKRHEAGLRSERSFQNKDSWPSSAVGPSWREEGGREGGRCGRGGVEGGEVLKETGAEPRSIVAAEEIYTGTQPRAPRVTHTHALTGGDSWKSTPLALTDRHSTPTAGMGPHRCARVFCNYLSAC